jgi:hypothetical protein
MAFDENKFEWFFKRVENNNNRKLLEFIEKTVKNILFNASVATKFVICMNIHKTKKRNWF